MLANLIRHTAAPMYHRQVISHLDCATGLENIPRTGPVVIVANHSSYADHFVLLTLIHAVRPGQVWFPTKAEAFERFASRIWHESMHCFPVNRQAPSESVFTTASEVLDAGEVLVLYPEGTRGNGRELLPFKSGAFRMALAGDAPVIPVGLWNLNQVLPKGARRINPDLLNAAIGKALVVPSGQDERTVAATMRDDARLQIETLIAHARRTSPADRLRASDEIAGLIGRIVTENLTAAGKVPPPVLRRLQLLVAIGQAVGRRNEAPLRVQAARLQALKATNAPTPLTRVPRIALANVRATQLAAQNRNDRFAAYLAGRTNMLTPSWAHGGAARARAHFDAATRDADLASKAYLGLGQALRRCGQEEAAQAAWAAALRSLNLSDPRAVLRRARIEALMDDKSTNNESPVS